MYVSVCVCSPGPSPGPYSLCTRVIRTLRTLPRQARSPGVPSPHRATVPYGTVNYSTFSRHPLCPPDAHRVVRVDDTCVRFRRNSARPCKMMVLHDVYGRDARHEARRATGHVLGKSLNRARHPTVLVGWIRLFCLKCPKNPTVLVGWEMSEIFSGMNQKTPLEILDF